MSAAKRVGRRKPTTEDILADVLDHQQQQLMQAHTVSSDVLDDVLKLQLAELIGKNHYSSEVLNVLAGRKRPVSTSRHRASDSSEIDMSSLAEHLCNRRFKIKNIQADVKVIVVFG